MTNLLQETLENIKDSGHTIEDIFFIGSETGKYSCSWEEFKVLADQEYDQGFGGQEVAYDLIIFFKDNHIMTREEYDGSEWWEYRSSFDKDNIQGKAIKTLFTLHGQSFEEAENDK